MLSNPNWRRTRPSLVALVATLSLAACRSSAAPSRGPEGTLPRQVATPQPSHTQESAEPSPVSTDAAVLSQYLAFWEAVTAASERADPHYPALEETTAGPQLEQLRRILTRYREQGRVRRGQGTHHGVVRQIVDDGRAAVVDDCAEVDPAGGLFDAQTGERVESGGEPGQRQLLEARLELLGGNWKVVNVNVVEERSACQPIAA